MAPHVTLLPPVLLVVHDADDRRMVTLLLRGTLGEVQVQEADGAPDLVRALQRGGCGVVITDHRLPWMAGAEVVRLVRELRPGCPVVVVGGSAPDPDDAELLRLGPEGFVTRSGSGLARLGDVVRTAVVRARRAAATGAMDAPYRRLMESMPVGVLVATRDGSVLEANAALAGALGYATPEDLAFRSVDSLLTGEGAAGSWRRLVADLPAVGRLNARLRRRDGGEIPVRVTVWSDGVRSDRDQRVYGLVAPVAEANGGSGSRAGGSAAPSDGADPVQLDQMVYAVSHDLRQPLSRVVRYLDLLQEEDGGELSGDGRDFLEQARRAAASLEQMVDGVLRYSRIETQGAAFEPVDLGRVLARVLERLDDVRRAAGAEVTHDDLPTVVADPAQMEQLLQNLLSNAFKFRGSEPLEVHVGAAEEDDAWHLWVRDTGIGIDPDQVERIFGMFQRLHTASEYPGTGIGLAICRRIVDRHRGRIWVDSEPGSGATFHVTLARPSGDGRAGRTEP